MPRVLARTLTGASLALGCVLLLFLDRVAPASVVPWAAASLLAALAAWELTRMGSLREERLARPLGTAVVVLTLAFFPLAIGSSPLPDCLGAGRTLLLAYLVTGLVALLAAMGRSGGTSSSPGSPRQISPRPISPRSGVFLALWALPPLYGLILVHAEWGIPGLAALILLAKIGDILAYFVGRTIGRRHPFPRLSPGKTVAGCVASLIGGIVAGVIVSVSGLLPTGSLGVLGAAGVGLAINVAAQAGDLAESWVKRRSGVKDSSTLVGPSGGVLDVVDSFLLCLPVAILLFPVAFV
jgi:CDP-diglyceride synthetase